ncbi:hypothetical protein [Nostoc linckia]|uniref:hypothetical protein n=1 Tax=Nostoc linckia TaxID=92942 RepID=UPI0015D48BB7|nr:hypothetical protein [Nostoc linckia]
MFQKQPESAFFARTYAKTSGIPHTATSLRVLYVLCGNLQQAALYLQFSVTCA